MANSISQEYFDSVVKENMELLDMTPEEALHETVEQFNAQNVNLNHIIKTVEAVLGENPITILFEQLKDSTCNQVERIDQMDIFKKLLSIDPAYRIAAGKIGIYPLIMDLMENPKCDDNLRTVYLSAISALMNGYPDLLDERGISYIFHELTECESQDILKEILKWIKNCCIKHEKNRQAFMRGDIGKRLFKFLNSDINPELLRLICSVIAALSLDDDIREVISQSHNHASTLALELLPTLVSLIQDFSGDVVTLCELFSALSSLLVRNEFCSTMANSNGLSLILSTFSYYKTNEKLHRRIFQILGCLAGNEEVRNKIIASGAGPMIAFSMETHLMSEELYISAFKCLAKLCLRSPRNCEQLMDLGVVDLIFKFMTSKENNTNVLVYGCRVLRNMVSHNPEIRSRLLEMGAEEFLYESIDRVTECQEDVKILLKDMGCEVKLKEEWTGEKGNKLKN